MKKNRVVVTGRGVVSCLGNSVEEFHKNLIAGVSGIDMIDAFPCEDYPTRFAGQVRNLETDGIIDKKLNRRLDNFIRYGIVAANEALKEASLATEEERASLVKERCGIVLGSGMGGMQVFGDGLLSLDKNGFKRTSPFLIPYMITNMAGGQLGIELDFMGPNYSISTACATANYCFVNAANHIRKGDADLVVCGGTEASILPIGLAGFVACKALSKNNEDPKAACRPWDKSRDGFVMSEGAGVLVLESLEHAQARGATILAEYIGGGLSCDAFHITSPRPGGEGMALCMKAALEDAEIAKEEVDYVNAHATSTPAGDLEELRGIKSIFGDHSKKMKINATKSMVGHALGASGGLEAIALLKALETGQLHPTLNLKDPEPELAELDPVGDKAEQKDISVALSNSFGFGGHNSTVLFRKWT